MERKRMIRGNRKKVCSKCGHRPIRNPNQRLCKECHAENMRMHRIVKKMKSCQ